MTGQIRLCLAAILSATLFTSAAGAASRPAMATGLSPLTLLERLSRVAPDLDRDVLRNALGALNCASSHGADRADRLAVIDYSQPSTRKRMWVFDLRNPRLLLQELVAHGRGSGENLATRFSNTEGSHQSSIGLFRAAETYQGKHGYSLRVDGLEPGFNDRARERAIVIHGAEYVASSLIAGQGRIGRSLGCPAVRPEVARMVIDSLKGGQFIFAWYPDKRWLRGSAYLNCAASRRLAAADGAIKHDG